VDALYRQEKITNRVFAFYMTDEFHPSTFQIGGYDPFYIKPNSGDLRYIPLSG
jgi:hypothetical protein